MKKKSPAPHKTQVAEALHSFVGVAEAIAALLKPHAEVVIHDLAKGSIAYIANNISRRSVGDSSLTDLEDLEPLEANVVGPYRKTNFDGRELKSVTAILRGPDSIPFGLLCINFDIAVIESARSILDALTALGGPDQQPAALFRSDWQEAVNRLVADVLKSRGLEVSALSKPDHAEIIDSLDRGGYFAIRNVVPYVARLLGISRATVYKHMKDARGRND